MPVEQARLNNSLLLENANPTGAATKYARASRTGWTSLGGVSDTYEITGLIQFNNVTPGSVAIGTNADSGATTYPFKMDIDSSGKLRCWIYDGTNNPKVSSTTTIVAGTFYRFFFQRNVPDDKLYIYIADTLENETADTTTGTCANTKKLGFAHDGGLFNAANINIVDFRVFNRALTDDERTAINDNWFTDVNGANPADYKTSLLAWYPLNGSTLDRSVLNSNDITTQDAEWSIDFPIAFSIPDRDATPNRFLLPTTAQKSLSHDGATSYATFPIAPSASGFCLSFWLDPQGSAINASFLTYLPLTNSGGFKLYRLSTDQLGFYIKNLTVTDANLSSGTNTLKSSKFSYITILYVPNNLTLKINNTTVATDTSVTMTDPDVAQFMTMAKNSAAASGYAQMLASRLTLHNRTTIWTSDEENDLYWRNIIPDGAYHWSLNNTLLDQNGENALTASGTSFVDDAPFQPRSAV